jgi:hypothetical protein
MKINLLIDTNSLSHISGIEIKRQKLIKLVLGYFNVYTCKVIVEEFGDGIDKANQKNKATYSLLKKTQKHILPESRNTRVIEKTLKYLGYIKTLSKEDKGERCLVSMALENVYFNKFSQCILLTDDQTAVDKFLNSINNDFQFGRIWSVFDLIFFLFFNLRINFENARDAIRDLVASSSISVRKYRHFKHRYYDEEESRQMLLKENLKRLDKLKKMLNALPRR